MVVHDEPPFVLRSMRYPTIVPPPVLVGAVHVNDTSFVPPVAARLVGAEGAVNGVSLAVLLYVPRPAALIAATRNAYDVPFARPVTV